MRGRRRRRRRSRAEEEEEGCGSWVEMSSLFLSLAHLTCSPILSFDHGVLRMSPSSRLTNLCRTRAFFFFPSERFCQERATAAATSSRAGMQQPASQPGIDQQAAPLHQPVTSRSESVRPRSPVAVQCGEAAVSVWLLHLPLALRAVCVAHIQPTLF
ncbi:hypothetical protein P167DRAFT_417450 [Morchella conica CCBAS932]|uniref:Uncharacterized protein n=1 Tax=Morchella conica CCBAS932 TaxID=1392247 RepID=A0A3N4KNB4_9PEZI|nr:hypothetical protein P167DRAFT_417450 [Morchella conica CCBAS932]